MNTHTSASGVPVCGTALSGKTNLLKTVCSGVLDHGKYLALAWLITASVLGMAWSDHAFAGTGAWWKVVPEQENPSPYYDSILYSEIPPKLREIELNSSRVKIDVIGQSAGGRNLFLASVSSGNLGGYQSIQKLMLSDPEKALKNLSAFPNIKVPVAVLAGINGDEYPTVDAAIRLLETLAYQNDPDTLTILNNALVLLVVVGNPDGRVGGTPANAFRPASPAAPSAGSGGQRPVRRAPVDPHACCPGRSR